MRLLLIPVVVVPTVEVVIMLRRRVACLIRRRLSLLGEYQGGHPRPAKARKARNSTYTVLYQGVSVQNMNLSFPEWVSLPLFGIGVGLTKMATYDSKMAESL